MRSMLIYAGISLAAFAVGWIANESLFASRLSSVQHANALVIASLEERVRQQEMTINRLQQGKDDNKHDLSQTATLESRNGIWLPRHLLSCLQIWPALTPSRQLNDDLVEIFCLTEKECADVEGAMRQAWEEITAEEAKKVATLESHEEKAVLAIGPFAEEGAAVKMRLQTRLAEIMGQRKAEDFFTVVGEQIDRLYLDFGRCGRLISISLRRHGEQMLYEIIEERQETPLRRQPLSGRLVPNLPAEWRRYERWLPPLLKAGLPAPLAQEQP